MTGMIIDIVGFFCGLYVAYRAGKYIGRENGYYDGHSEAYRELEHIIDNYIENLNKEFDAKNTSTKGA